MVTYSMIFLKQSYRINLLILNMGLILESVDKICMFFSKYDYPIAGIGYPDWVTVGQRRNLKSRLFKELNQPIDYTPKYTFKR